MIRNSPSELLDAWNSLLANLQSNTQWSDIGRIDFLSEHILPIDAKLKYKIGELIRIDKQIDSAVKRCPPHPRRGD